MLFLILVVPVVHTESINLTQSSLTPRFDDDYVVGWTVSRMAE